MPTTRNAAPDPIALGIKVGDFFVSSWGYDQTNIDFYKVVGVTAKCVKIQKVNTRVTADHFSQDEVEPGWEPVKGHWVRRDGVSTYDPEAPAPVMLKRVQSGYKGAPTLTMTSYSIAQLWDGKPQYQTASGFGH